MLRPWIGSRLGSVCAELQVQGNAVRVYEPGAWTFCASAVHPAYRPRQRLVLGRYHWDHLVQRYILLNGCTLLIVARQLFDERFEAVFPRFFRRFRNLRLQCCNYISNYLRRLEQDLKVKASLFARQGQVGVNSRCSAA
jgi:hypothetical protein